MSSASNVDTNACRRLCVVKQCVGWLNENRRVGTRFEKLGIHFHGMLQLTIIKRHVRMRVWDKTLLDLILLEVRV